MKVTSRTPPYPLRISETVREAAQAEANKSRRSLNTELGILIEEGLAWRQKQAQARA